MTSRGKNFTERERQILLEIVQKYKHIIENKCTNAISTLKKNEAWETITKEFNSTAEVPRTFKQLSTAYLNLKRKTRQNVADINVKQYLEQKKNDLCDNQAGPSKVITLIDETNSNKENIEIYDLIKQLKKDEIADKKGIMITGGGLHKPVLGTVGAQILSIMGDQVKPLSNTCDSASSYYKNVEDVTICDDLVPVKSKLPDAQSCNTTLLRHKKKTQKAKLIKNNVDLKTKYYKTKMECVNLEKRNKLLEYRLTLKHHKLLDLEIKIKQKEYENMIKE